MGRRSKADEIIWEREYKGECGPLPDCLPCGEYCQWAICSCGDQGYMEIIKYSDGRQVTANSGFATKHHEHSLRLIGYPVMESAVCSGSWPDTVITDRPDLDDVKALKDSDPDCANEKCHSKGNYGVVYKEEKLLPLCKPCYEQWSGNKHWSWRDKF